MMRRFFLSVLALIFCLGIVSCARSSKEVGVEEVTSPETSAVEDKAVEDKAVEDKAVEDKAVEDKAPEQKVLTFSMAGYTTGGKKEWEIRGDSADIFAAEQVRLKNVTIKIYESTNPVTITAEEGSYDKVGSNARLEKNVVVALQDGGKLWTDYLDWEVEAKTIKTDAYARVERDNLTFWGKGLFGRPELKVVQMSEDITVEIKDKEDTTRAPTVITCDGPLEIDYELNLAKFFKNVEVSDHRGKLLSDRMDVFIDREMRRISKVICLGNVRIIHQGSNTISSEAVYLVDEGKVILTGSPRLVIYPDELEEVGNQ